MPSYLIFHRNNEPVLRHEVKDKTISIGRDASCDIQLLESDISRIHCTVAWANGEYLLTDMSTNGTLVDGNKVSVHKLRSGNVITVGEWKMIFQDSKKESLPRETVVRDAAPTKILKFEAGEKKLVSESILLNFASAGGKMQEYKITNAAIGAAPGNDIVIEGDPYISGRHCAIKAEADGFIVTDIGSSNGTFLNDRKIVRERLPAEGVLTVGKTKISFSIKQSSERLKPVAKTSLGPIIGKNEKMREMFSLLTRISPSEATVFISGESGTGKELVARYIHENSPRRLMPFIAINCGAIPENLIESELFGHERGAFTSATNQHRGIFEQAHGGTLFLDEIGEMPLDLQTRLLRVLETKQVRRVGGQTDFSVAVRIVAATNKDTKVLIEEGKFREDLFFRLYVVPIILPPLRERREDIILIAEHILTEISPDGRPKFLNKPAQEKLLNYIWPGNVRELKNTLQRAVLVVDSNEITENDIVFAEVSAQKLKEELSLEGQEKKAILNALANAKGNVSEAAKILEIARTTLTSMAQKYRIPLDEYRKK